MEEASGRETQKDGSMRKTQPNIADFDGWSHEPRRAGGVWKLGKMSLQKEFSPANTFILPRKTRIELVTYRTVRKSICAV